jgi:hypothetical protein
MAAVQVHYKVQRRNEEEEKEEVSESCESVLTCQVMTRPISPLFLYPHKSLTLTFIFTLQMEAAD